MLQHLRRVRVNLGVPDDLKPQALKPEVHQSDATEQAPHSRSHGAFQDSAGSRPFHWIFVGRFSAQLHLSQGCSLYGFVATMAVSPVSRFHIWKMWVGCGAHSRIWVGYAHPKVLGTVVGSLVAEG